MCGITGISIAAPNPNLESIVQAMTSTIVHRGPDSDGVMTCRDGRSALGFRRLAIRDLDPRADQPMNSFDQSTTVAFNGEIYNPGALARRFCSGFSFRTTGDTERLLEAYSHQGSRIFEHCNGMFAAAFLQHKSGRITLVRDRMGMKPLYVYQGTLDGQPFVAFASEIRAFQQFGLEPNPETAGYYFHLGYMPSPVTFFHNVTQVCPGEVVEIEAGRIVSRWHFHKFVDQNWADKSIVDHDSLAQTLDDAVRIRTLSDVPVGAFLSGGIDSSLVAASLKRSGCDIPTFTVSFNNERFNEAPFAADIASHLGLRHEVLPIDERKLPDMIEDYLDCYEQPYVDSSGLPSMLLCREVRKHVTVAISGDGGDEFFGGYYRYDVFRKMLSASRLPSMATRLIGAMATRIDQRRGERIQSILNRKDAAGIYSGILQQWHGNRLSDLLPDLPDVASATEQLIRDVFSSVDADDMSRASCFDATYYIPDDLQVKMDRASMRYALEVRCPLLDFRVAEFGSRLSTRAKFAGGKKAVLKKLLGRRVPEQLFDRPKKGFSVPMAEWLRGPLRESVLDAVSGSMLNDCGWLNPRAMRDVVDRFYAGNDGLYVPVWMLFVMSKSLERCARQSRQTTFELQADRQVA